MPLTPKEQGGGSAPVFPLSIKHSALIEASYSSTGEVAADCTIALGWKPTNVGATPLNDATGHYLLTIQKQGSAVRVWEQATELAAYGGSIGSTYAEFVQNVLTHYAGSPHGYYSRLVIVEAALDYSSFWGASDLVTGLWVPKNISGISVHTLLDFSNGANLGEDTAYLQFENIAPDHDFSEGADGGWSTSGDVSIVTGTASVSTASTFSVINKTNLDSQKQYLIKCVVDSVVGTINLVKNNATKPDSFIDITAPGTYCHLAPASAVADTCWVGLQCGVGESFSISTLSIYETDASYAGPNDWTITGTQTTDTPTNNHCVYNSLNHFDGVTLSNGNKTGRASTYSQYGIGTYLLPDSGKWYFEGYGPSPTASCGVGLMSLTALSNSDYTAGQIRYVGSGNIVKDASGAAYGAAYSGDAATIGVAVDMDNLTIEFLLNNVSQGVISTASSPSYDLGTGRWMPYTFHGSNGQTWNLQINDDLTYAPPDGYLPLCSANFPEPTILKSVEVADIVLREGTGAATSVSSLLFQPDFVDIKGRTTNSSWLLLDSERGALNVLTTNALDAAEDYPNTLTSFNSNGYSLGDYNPVNQTGASFIDLCLKAGVEQGFEIVYPVVLSGGGTFNHGLGKKPTFIVFKSVTISNHWFIWHTALGESQYLLLDETRAAGIATDWCVPTATNVSISSAAGDGAYIAYVFTDSDIFKAFSYIGNGSADGPFVNLGGRPLSIPFLKNADAAAGWVNQDTARNPHNPVNTYLLAGSATTEATTVGDGVYATSQGFKVVNGYDTGWNEAGDAVVGLAVLASTTKYANAF